MKFSTVSEYFENQHSQSNMLTSLFFCLSFRFGEIQMCVFEVVDCTCSSESYYFVELLQLVFELFILQRL